MFISILAPVFSLPFTCDFGTQFLPNICDFKNDPSAPFRFELYFGANELGQRKIRNTLFNSFADRGKSSR